jgi:hypothetical protein
MSSTDCGKEEGRGLRKHPEGLQNRRESTLPHPGRFAIGPQSLVYPGWQRLARKESWGDIVSAATIAATSIFRTNGKNPLADFEDEAPKTAARGKHECRNPKVRTRAELKKFVAFPELSTPMSGTGTILSLRRYEYPLTLKKIPPFDSCEAQYWTAWKEGRMVGRSRGSSIIVLWKNGGKSRSFRLDRFYR